MGRRVLLALVSAAVLVGLVPSFGLLQNAASVVAPRGAMMKPSQPPTSNPPM